jgi:hypothetical protein
VHRITERLAVIPSEVSFSAGILTIESSWVVCYGWYGTWMIR